MWQLALINIVCEPIGSSVPASLMNVTSTWPGQVASWPHPAWLVVTTTISFTAGLLYWAWLDWRTLSVPATPYEWWCGIIGLLLGYWHPQTVLPALVVFAAFTLIATLTHGLGAADPLLLGLLFLRVALIDWLWLVLLACLTTLLQAWARPQAAYPFITHLTIGYCLVQVVAFLL